MLRVARTWTLPRLQSLSLLKEKVHGSFSIQAGIKIHCTTGILAIQGLIHEHGAWRQHDWWLWWRQSRQDTQVINASNCAIITEGQYYRCVLFRCLKVLYIFWLISKMKGFYLYSWWGFLFFNAPGFYLSLWRLLAFSPQILPLGALGQELWLIKKELKQRDWVCFVTV